MDIQSAAITGAVVAASDYALTMASPAMYGSYSRPVQLFVAGVAGSLIYGFLMPNVMG